MEESISWQPAKRVGLSPEDRRKVWYLTQGIAGGSGGDGGTFMLYENNQIMLTENGNTMLYE